jgi:hypothetical protein
MTKWQKQYNNIKIQNDENNILIETTTKLFKEKKHYSKRNNDEMIKTKPYNNRNNDKMINKNNIIIETMTKCLNTI